MIFCKKLYNVFFVFFLRNKVFYVIFLVYFLTPSQFNLIFPCDMFYIFLLEYKQFGSIRARFDNIFQVRFNFELRPEFP